MVDLNKIILQTRTDLYAYLKINKITQQECADLFGITRSHLNKVLNGVTLPSIPLLQNMINLVETNSSIEKGK